MLVAFLAAIVVGIAESWLYISHARRSAKRHAEGEEIRRSIERQAGPSSPDTLGEEGKENTSEPKVTSLGEVTGPGSMEKTAATAGSLAFESGLEDAHQTSRLDPASRQPEIRLRRKPLNESI